MGSFPRPRIRWLHSTYAPRGRSVRAAKRTKSNDVGAVCQASDGPRRTQRLERGSDLVDDKVRLRLGVVPAHRHGAVRGRGAGDVDVGERAAVDARAAAVARQGLPLGP